MAITHHFLTFRTQLMFFLLYCMQSCTYAPNNSRNTFTARQMVIGSKSLPNSSIVSDTIDDYNADDNNENPLPTQAQDLLIHKKASSLNHTLPSNFSVPHRNQTSSARTSKFTPHNAQQGLPTGITRSSPHGGVFPDYGCGLSYGETYRRYLEYMKRQ